jgi:hypothetical protein
MTKNSIGQRWGLTNILVPKTEKAVTVQQAKAMICWTLIGIVNVEEMRFF